MARTDKGDRKQSTAPTLCLEAVVLRLSDSERNVLKILNSALKVSEYTDDVDNIRAYQREEKMATAMSELFRTITGLSLVAKSLPVATRKKMEESAQDSTVYGPVLAPIFEVGRRFKRFNPDKMRSEYGKLVMLLQDSHVSRLRSRLGITTELVTPVLTVGAALASIGASALLEDDRLDMATTLQVTVASRGKAAQKEEALQFLIAQYGGPAPAAGTETDEKTVSTNNRRELIERCVRSIDDARVFIQLNSAPARKLITHLESMYGKGKGGPYGSLEIRRGVQGSCLSHSHDDQFKFVFASLTLWRIIQRDMFDFWEAVEKDMIGEGASSYRFMDTQQGYHRVSSAPNTASRMQVALSEARSAVGGEWVGLSVVHLGDNDVPNALVFIDKYTIIPRLLTPIVTTIDALEQIFVEGAEETHPGLRNLLKSKYGSFDELKGTILGDFFRHGFDGSGDDGGSCIDGRLTSAWNWCSLLHKKPYYDAFLLAGFTGFDAAYN